MAELYFAVSFEESRIRFAFTPRLNASVSAFAIGAPVSEHLLECFAISEPQPKTAFGRGCADDS